MTWFFKNGIQAESALKRAVISQGREKVNRHSEHLPANDDQEYSGKSSISNITSLISGGKWTIAVVAAAVFTLVALYTYLTKPIYESTSRVVIDFRGGKGNQGALEFTGSVAATKITNELETLMSYSLSESVAEVLAKTQYADKEGKTVLPILYSSSEDSGGYQRASIAEVARRLSQVTDFTPVKESDIIKISARSPDPREAALIANTYTDVYIERDLSLSRAKSRAVREFLQSQVEAKRRTLDSTEGALRNYMQSTNTVSLDNETNKLVQQLAQLEATRDAADVEIKSRDQTLQSYKSELAVQEPAIARAIGESNDSYIRLLQEQLARLEVQRDFVLSQNPDILAQGNSAPQLREVEAQIASLKKNLQARTQTYLSSLSPGDRSIGGNEGSAQFLSQMKQKIIEQKIELDGLRAKRDALAAVIADYELQFAQLPRRSIELAKLQRVRLSNEKLFTLVDEKFNEAAITEKSEFGSVNIIDPATVPYKPVSPRVMVNLILGLLVGLGAGVGIVVARSALNSKVRAPEDIKLVGLPTLAVISRMVLDVKGNNGHGRPRVQPKGMDLHLIAHTHRNSPLVESYRHLFSGLKIIDKSTPLKKVLVTSVKQGEGKSITVSNLAIVAAEADMRVVLVDTDLRRPAVHTIFGKPMDPGIMNILAGEGMPGVIHVDVLPNLHVMCSGVTPPNPSAVIGSIKMRDLLEGLSRDFDLVLLDSPPVFAVNDALVLATIVDGIILVASAGDTTRTELEEAIEAFGEMKDKILGVVLNNFSTRKTYRAVPGGYGYGYNRYGAAYYKS